MTEDKEKIYVCRCEEITAADIERAIEEGATTLTAIKVRTNAGMGVCQGMTCRKNIERMLREKKLDPGCYQHSPYRFPVRTVGVSELSADAPAKEAEEGGHE